MPNPNTPWGLQPIQRKGSADYRGNLTPYFIPANTTAAMFVGDPVVRSAASADTQGVPGIVLAAAGSTNKITGVIVGFLGVGNTSPSAPVGSFFGNSGAPGPLYKPANAPVGWYAMVDDDPNSLFVVQSNDAGGAPAATVVGKNANLVAGNGSAYTGWSGWQLAANSIGTSANAQVAIVGFEQEVDNTPGLVHAKLVVRINQTTEGVATTGI